MFATFFLTPFSDEEACVLLSGSVPNVLTGCRETFTK